MNNNRSNTTSQPESKTLYQIQTNVECFNLGLNNDDARYLLNLLDNAEETSLVERLRSQIYELEDTIDELRGEIDELEEERSS